MDILFTQLSEGFVARATVLFTKWQEAIPRAGPGFAAAIQQEAVAAAGAARDRIQAETAAASGRLCEQATTIAEEFNSLAQRCKAQVRLAGDESQEKWVAKWNEMEKVMNGEGLRLTQFAKDIQEHPRGDIEAQIGYHKGVLGQQFGIRLNEEFCEMRAHLFEKMNDKFAKLWDKVEASVGDGRSTPPLL